MSERRRPNRKLQAAARELAREQNMPYQKAYQQLGAELAAGGLEPVPAADRKLALIGVQSCGCITLVDCSDEPGRETQKEVAEIVARGGAVERVALEEAKLRPDFFPSECPHDPQGWEPKAEPDPNEVTFRFKRAHKAGIAIVYGKNRYYPRGLRAGEVMQLGGQWLATEGWMRPDGSASNGRTEGGDAHVQTGFSSKREAAQWLADRFAVRTTARAKERWEQREANPPQRSGPVPTVTSSGQPVPDFKVGDIWTAWDEDYEILDLPEVRESVGGGAIVRVRPLDAGHRAEDDWLRPSWMYLGDSMFAGMTKKG